MNFAWFIIPFTIIVLACFGMTFFDDNMNFRYKKKSKVDNKQLNYQVDHKIEFKNEKNIIRKINTGEYEEEYIDRMLVLLKNKIIKSIKHKTITASEYIRDNGYIKVEENNREITINLHYIICSEHERNICSLNGELALFYKEYKLILSLNEIILKEVKENV